MLIQLYIMDWTENNKYISGVINKLDTLSDPVRIAGFDLDDTLIHKPSKRKGLSKWIMIDNTINKKIKQLVSDGYIIILFTNQGGMSMSKNFDRVKWRASVDEVIEYMFIGISKYYVATYVAKNYDMYRKPNLGMWDLMKGDLKETFELDNLRISKRSFFCGDAAGRTSNSPIGKKLHPNAKADFSDSDRKFALNIGIEFKTPEDFYMKDPPEMPYKLSGFDPKEYIKKLQKQKKYVFKPRTKEMILMIGPPGSGKTEFVKKYILKHDYIHINQDICKTKKKCLELTEASLEDRENIVIDNTNPDISSRMAYTMLAKKYKYKHVRVFVLNTNINLAKHLNNVRHLYSEGEIPRINNITYNTYAKNYIAPTKEEYIDMIENVDFAFNHSYLNDPVWKRLFMKYSE
jgi:bifunctional polynucleotide phosphatase/kinase